MKKINLLKICLVFIIFTAFVVGRVYYHYWAGDFIKGDIISLNGSILFEVFFNCAIFTVLTSLCVIFSANLGFDEALNKNYKILTILYIVAGGILFNSFSNNENFFDERDFKKVYVEYISDYSSDLGNSKVFTYIPLHRGDKTRKKTNINFPNNKENTFFNSKLAVLNDFNRSVFSDCIDNRLNFDTYVNIGNFRNINKTELFEMVFKKSTRKCIESYGDFELMKKKHLLLKTKNLSPYTDDDFISKDSFSFVKG